MTTETIWVITIACGEQFKITTTSLERAIKLVRQYTKAALYGNSEITKAERLSVVVLP